MVDDVSTDFLGYVPAEVERVVARLHEERDAARAEAEQARRDGQEQTAGLHEKLAEVRAELAVVKRQRDALRDWCSLQRAEWLAHARTDSVKSVRASCAAVAAAFGEVMEKIEALAAEQPKPQQPEGGA